MMLKLDNLVVKSGNILTKIRLSIYILTLSHLVFMAVCLLGQDYSKSKDPHLQLYVKLKWKLITTWFNLLQVPYLLMSIYCDWKGMKLEAKPKFVRLMNKIRHFFFTSIIFPVTVFSDIMFWCLYNKDKTLVMPLSADEYISVWDHHSMHTVSLVFVLFDLICLLRRRPNDMTAGIITLTAFITLYLSVCFHSSLNGEHVYPVLGMLSTSKLVICIIYIYIANLFYYTGQWIIVDTVWGQGRVKN